MRQTFLKRTNVLSLRVNSVLFILRILLPGEEINRTMFRSFRNQSQAQNGSLDLKGEFHVSAHGQTVTSAHLIPLLLKQSKALMQETETIL